MRSLDFSLYNLNNSEIPQIKISNFGFDSCATGRIVYRFSDGEYEKELYYLFETRFFRNQQGELFFIERDGLGPSYKFSVIIFDGDKMRAERLCDDCLPDPSTLLRVRSLTALEEKITNIVRGN